MSSARSHPQPVFNRIELVQIIHTYRREHEERGLPWVLDLTFHPSELVHCRGATAAESPRSQNLSQGYTFLKQAKFLQMVNQLTSRIKSHIASFSLRYFLISTCLSGFWHQER